MEISSVAVATSGLAIPMLEGARFRFHLCAFTLALREIARTGQNRISGACNLCRAQPYPVRTKINQARSERESTK
jgi:hypothetical protein